MKLKYEIKKIHKQTLMGGMIAIVLCSHFLLFGCTGATIRENLRIPLVADQPYEGVSKTGHYILEYRFTFHPKAADGTGSNAARHIRVGLERRQRRPRGFGRRCSVRRPRLGGRVHSADPTGPAPVGPAQVVPDGRRFDRILERPFEQ